MTSLSWADPAVPSAEDCVVRYALERQAAAVPDRVYVEFEDGSTWTFAETLAHVRQAATAFAHLGVRKGDIVLLWLPNGREFLLSWFAANYLGASIAAPNIAYRGGILQHAIGLIEPRIAVVHESLLARLEGIDIGPMETIVKVRSRDEGAETTYQPMVSVRSAEDVFAAKVDDALLDDPGIAPWDMQMLLYTSGTTGPSKAAIATYVHTATVALVTVEDRVAGGARYLLNMPMSHLSGIIPVMGMLLTGNTVIFSPPFKTDTFWEIVHARKPTICSLLSATAVFIENLPPSASDADNSLQWAFCTPLVKDPPAFSKRFGLNVATSYGMSELSAVIRSAPNPINNESCGQVRAGYEARIVDEFDRELPIGEIGELIVRCNRPWAVSPGYWKNAEATVAAWQNGWFHTGDNFRKDAEENYYFVDRKKDAIRRRGENISSYEVELQALKHPAVAEAAVVAVPSEVEDDVLLVVTVKPGETLAERDLFDFLSPNMAHFMLPRYIRRIETMPKTPSLRIQKYVLRGEGVTADTWDRVAAGIRVRREVIV